MFCDFVCCPLPVIVINWDLKFTETVESVIIALLVCRRVLSLQRIRPIVPFDGNQLRF